jgi:hypothetical protein
MVASSIDSVIVDPSGVERVRHQAIIRRDALASHSVRLLLAGALVDAAILRGSLGNIARVGTTLPPALRASRSSGSS